mgnify:FL=1
MDIRTDATTGSTHDVAGACAKRLLRLVLIVASAVLAAACATKPTAVTLDGVVVEGGGLAGAEERGLVRVVRGSTVIDNRTRMTLQSGDEVITGPSAYAVIRYPSGTEVFMRPNTRGRIGSFTDVVGEVFAKIRGVFAVQSTLVRAGADGTAYLVRVQPSGEATVIVFDGQVNMSSLTGAWAPYRLPTGMVTMTRPQAQPRQMAASQEELLRARGWVERLETLVPEQHAISKGKTAAALAIGGLIAIIIGNRSDDDDNRGRGAGAEGKPPYVRDSVPPDRGGRR